MRLGYGAEVLRTKKAKNVECTHSKVLIRREFINLNLYTPGSVYFKCRVKFSKAHILP